MPWPEVAAYALAIGLRPALRAAQGVVRGPAPAARHEPADGHRRRRRHRHRRAVRGRHRRLPVLALADPRRLERRAAPAARSPPCSTSPRRPSGSRPRTARSARCRPPTSPVGTRFVVRPGERIPLDGRVLDGGEQRRPGADHRRERAGAAKQPGDEVFAGTINGDGALEVESTRRRGGHHARPHHPHGRGGAQPARPGRAVGREASPPSTPRR